MRGRTPKDRGDAALKAEEQLTTEGRPNEEPAIIRLVPGEIRTIPELFQPREFSYGTRTTDKDHVTGLTRALEARGELDPIVVIKLKDNGWVCVDGHHRLAAYIKAGKTTIECEWFGGTVREAIDKSMELNNKDRLNVPQEDRLEEAWKRVVLEGWSKSEIVKLCGVGDGTVATMRRIYKTAHASNKLGRCFRERLGEKKINELSWAQARLIYAGVDEKKITEAGRAAKLAKRLKSRMTDLLSRDPIITAEALKLYDPELPDALVRHWEPYSEKAAQNRSAIWDDAGEL